MCCWEVDVDFDSAYELSAMPRSQLAGAGSKVKSRKKNDGEIASRDESAKGSLFDPGVDRRDIVRDPQQSRDSDPLLISANIS